MSSQLSRNGTEKREPFKIYGIPWYFFAVFSVVVLLAVYLGKLPKGMIGAFPLMIVLGAVLGMIGDNTPFVKTFLGGGAIVIIFGSAALSTNFGGEGSPFFILPEAAINIMKNFQVGEGFLDFYIASLITGSIMGMNRKLLIRAAIRYLPAILGGLVAALALAGITGALTGYGARQAALFVALPIMGGGMGAGAVPLSKIFGESLGRDPGEMINMMIPAVALGNALSIVAGGLLNRLGKAKPSLTGVLLVGIGVAYTNLREIAMAFSPQYLLLVFVTVLGAILGAGFIGRLVGFYPIDSSITAGLCMANMGGTGDVAVLSAAERMELMPFAQISSRIGGAFVLILSSVILQIIGGG
jgi:Na+/citrate or Na+/malate symporter